MEEFDKYIPLRDYCRKHKWPRLAQWNNWIFKRKEIAQACVKKIGGRYFVDLEALRSYIKTADLEE